MKIETLPREQRRSIARRCFVDGQPVPHGLVSETVLRSWERSRHYGLQVSDRVIHGPIRKGDLIETQERMQALLKIAGLELGRLHESLPRGRWMLSCLSRDGMNVASTGCVPEGDLISGLRVGNILHETVAGTTAPGCTLAERRPVIISAGEHYLEEASLFTCAAAPVFDHLGDLAGALNASCSSDCRPMHLLEALVLSSKVIQRELVRRQKAAAYLHFHARADMLGTPLEGVLAVAPNGAIVGANEDARRTLSDTGSLDGVDVESLFGCSVGRLLDRVSGHRGHPFLLTLDNGLRLHARVEVPGRTSVSFSKPAAPSEESRTAQTDPVVARGLHHAVHAMRRNLVVLIQGETGTGKEVFARASHAAGSRAGGPFVAVNCSAIPAQLIEAELFGYQDGAFTGARRGGAPGRFEQAHGGTLLLDEIGDMPLELQPKLLRALQERSIARLGGGAERSVDVALLCATHLDLAELVAQKRFREDLYYRINGVKISLPPLRARADFAQIVTHILAREGGDAFHLSDAAFARLADFSWPGNIRQLDTVLRFAITSLECEGAGGGTIEPHHLPEEIRAAEPAGPFDRPGETPVTLRLTDELSNVEDTLLQEALMARDGNRTQAARDLGISRATLYRKLGRTTKSPEGK